VGTDERNLKEREGQRDNEPEKQVTKRRGERRKRDRDVNEGTERRGNDPRPSEHGSNSHHVRIDESDGSRSEGTR
jgi:hypothetical protein